MQDSTILKLGCPACGATYDPKSRSCQYCGCVLIVTGEIGSPTEGLANTNQASTAAKKWRQKIQADPDDGEAHFALGLCYLNCNLHDEAIEQLREACELIPESADAHYTLAATFLKKLDFEHGLSKQDQAEFEKQINYALRISPEFREARAFKAFANACKEPNDSPKALSEYKRAAELCPDVALFQKYLGHCFALGGNTGEAARCFEQALALNPNDGISCASLCALREAQGRYDEAIELGNRALSLDVDAHNVLARSLWAVGRRAEAKEQWLQAARLRPADGTISAALAKVEAYEVEVLAAQERARRSVRRGKALKVFWIGLGVVVLLGIMKHVPGVGAVSHFAGALLLFVSLFLLVLVVVAVVSPSAALFWTLPVSRPTSKFLAMAKNAAAGLACAFAGSLLVDESLLPADTDAHAPPVAQSTTAASPSPDATPANSSASGAPSPASDAAVAPIGSVPVKDVAFDQYREDLYVGPVVYPDFSGAQKQYREYRTRITDGAKSGVNFAGHYALVEFGCGAGCVTGYIVDVKSGEVHDLGYGGEEQMYLSLDGKPNSRLLKASYSNGQCVREAAVWDGSHFQVISRQISPYASDDAMGMNCPPIADTTTTSTSSDTRVGRDSQNNSRFAL